MKHLLVLIITILLCTSCTVAKKESLIQGSSMSFESKTTQIIGSLDSSHVDTLVITKTDTNTVFKYYGITKLKRDSIHTRDSVYITKHDTTTVVQYIEKGNPFKILVIAILACLALVFLIEIKLNWGCKK